MSRRIRRRRAIQKIALDYLSNRRLQWIALEDLCRHINLGIHTTNPRSLGVLLREWVRDGSLQRHQCRMNDSTRYRYITINQPFEYELGGRYRRYERF